MQVLNSSQHILISQNDSKNQIVLEFYGNQISLRVCSLIALKNQLHKIDIDQFYSSNSTDYDLEVINLPYCDRVLVLTHLQICELKEAIDEAFFGMRLNSLMSQSLHYNYI